MRLLSHFLSHSTGWQNSRSHTFSFLPSLPLPHTLPHTHSHSLTLRFSFYRVTEFWRLMVCLSQGSLAPRWQGGREGEREREREREKKEKEKEKEREKHKYTHVSIHHAFMHKQTNTRARARARTHTHTSLPSITRACWRTRIYALTRSLSPHTTPASELSPHMSSFACFKV